MFIARARIMESSTGRNRLSSVETWLKQKPARWHGCPAERAGTLRRPDGFAQRQQEPAMGPLQRGRISQVIGALNVA
jgi:hypothetical protein